MIVHRYSHLSKMPLHVLNLAGFSLGSLRVVTVHFSPGFMLKWTLK
jgi:hypothetical protein